MGLLNRMNESVARNNVYYPGGFTSTVEKPDDELTWLGRRLADTGIIEMPSTKPPGFYINWTTITSLVVVVSAIVGLWYFTWQTAATITPTIITIASFLLIAFLVAEPHLNPEGKGRYVKAKDDH